jgi:imidazolonepropionase-like amidohydrolase
MCMVGRRTLLQAAAAGAALTGFAGRAEAAQPQRTFAVRDVRVFDGKRVLEGATVISSRGRIIAVTRQPHLPRDMEVIDGTGQTLLPGLIDAHMHDAGVPRTDPPRFGVTTELDMFNVISRLRKDFGDYVAARKSYRPTATADLWSAGTMITVPGGHGSQMKPELPPDFPWLRPGMSPAKHVDDRLAEGSDFIKFAVEPMVASDPWPTISPDQGQAIIRRARERRVMSLAHVSTCADARWLLRAGVTGLIHTPNDTRLTQDDLRLARQSGAFVTSTLSIYHALAGNPGYRDLYADPRIAPVLSPAQHAFINTPFPPDFPGDKPDLPALASNVRALHAAGVPILAGTDGANPGIPNGVGLLVELELLVQAGLPPEAALTAATSAPAHHFALHDRGHIAPGRRADLVLVNGNPTVDITAIRDVTAVWRNGSRITRELR